MPKRLRSDDDDDSLTSLVKNHISDREVNRGVLMEVHMNKVYEKTMALLVKGQKNATNNNNNNKEEKKEVTHYSRIYIDMFSCHLVSFMYINCIFFKYWK